METLDYSNQTVNINTLLENVINNADTLAKIDLSNATIKGTTVTDDMGERLCRTLKDTGKLYGIEIDKSGLEIIGQACELSQDIVNNSERFFLMEPQKIRNEKCAAASIMATLTVMSKVDARSNYQSNDVILKAGPPYLYLPVDKFHDKASPTFKC